MTRSTSIVGNMTGFLDLPSEIISQIIAYLNDNDFRTSRLTSSSVERSTLSLFSKRFFRKRGFLTTSPSLQTLQNISQHPTIRKHNHHIWFNPDLYTFVTPECAPDPHWPYSVIYGTRSEEDRVKYEIYQDCVHDHQNLLFSSKLEEKLCAIFAGLPNLGVVGMRRSEDHSPWGWRRLKDAVGEDPRVLGQIPSGPMSSLSGATFLFVALVRALASTGAKVRRLYTDAIEIDNLRLETLPQERLQAAFASLWYLEINASKAWVTQKARNAFMPTEDEYGDGLLRVLQATPQLRELGLQIFRDLKQSYLVPPASRNRESWPESYPYLAFRKVATNAQLPFLRRVKLEKLITDPSTLIQFLKPSASNLSSLKLRDVRLLSTEEDRKPWRPIFTFLLERCANLSYLLLYHLMYEHGGISFVENPSVPVAYASPEDLYDAPDPTPGEPAGDELFAKYEHLAVEAKGRQAVVQKLRVAVERHWYQRPVFGYAMDEGLWHTDTSDEED